MRNVEEEQLFSDIEQLRIRFTGTQDLYREVCALMFFRYGITPTGNKLYQYVRKGSMSAPAEALAKFWTDLREKSRVRIDHPELPDEVKTAAGELVAKLWVQAQEASIAMLATHEAEMRAEVIAAKAAMKESITQIDGLHVERMSLQSELNQATEKIAALHLKLAAEVASRAALETQLAQTRADIMVLCQANEEARSDFTAEISQLSNEAELERERLRAAERRALMEIDRERSLADKLQKQLGVTQAEFMNASEQHRLESAGLYRDIGNMRQRIGLLEGELTSAKSQAQEVGGILQDARRQAADVLSHAASIEKERATWRSRAEEAEKMVHELKGRAVRKHKPRKMSSMPTK